MCTSIISTIIILCGCVLFAVAETLEDAALHFRTAYLEDIRNETSIYHELLDKESALAGLENSMRHELKVKNAQLLANTMCGNNTLISQAKTKELMKYFSENYERQLVEDILCDGLNELLNVKAPYQILVMLPKIFPDDGVEWFEMMVYSHIQLFHLYNLKKSNEDLKFLPKFAISLNNFRNHLSHTSSRSAYFKSKIDEIITMLPNNLKYLLFEPHFCLQNVLNSEYLFIATKKSYDVGSSTRKVYTWKDDWMDDPGYIKANIYNTDFEHDSTFLIELVGVQSGYKYYMMQTSNIIAAWKLNTEPLNYLFDIEFIDSDRVVLSQHGYVICAGERKDSRRREVKGFITEASAKRECQWYLGVCKH